MIELSRTKCKSIVPGPIVLGLYPLQLGLGKSPWHVAVASMLLCRTRQVQAEPVLRELLDRWPWAQVMAVSEGLEGVVKPCGLHRNRARQLQRFSVAWLGDSWNTMEDLPGVGVYVADAVRVFCFDGMEVLSKDRVLLDYVSKRVHI